MFNNSIRLIYWKITTIFFMLLTMWMKYCLYFGNFGLKKKMDRENIHPTYV